MLRIKWTDRTFNFNFPVELYPETIERVRGTPARIESRLRDVPTELLTRRDNDRWSMQENAGHLLDLEPLFALRLDEYLAGATQLHAADMTNRKTHDANHNNVPLDMILRNFRDQRFSLTERLENLGDEMFSRTALHPRLNRQMRLVDMLLFQCEHDDYHLARISELIQLFRA